MTATLTLLGITTLTLLITTSHQHHRIRRLERFLYQDLHNDIHHAFGPDPDEPPNTWNDPLWKPQGWDEP